MSIALTRVDFRLIHGQVITRWLKQCDINEIVTVDTALSKDEFMQDVFKMAAPKGVRIRILSVEEAVAAQENGEFERNRILVLLKSVQELTNAINAGRKAVNNAITLDRKDADQLLAIESKGINVYFQTTPDYPSETLQNAVKKLA